MTAPEVLSPVRRSEVLPPVKGLPEVVLPVMTAPEVLSPVRRSEVLPPVKSFPEVVLPVMTAPEVLPPRRPAPQVPPAVRRPEVLEPVRVPAAVFPPREVATRLIAEQLEEQHPSETAATLSAVERDLERQRQTLAHERARAAVKDARKRARAAGAPASSPNRIRRIADWVLNCARRVLERLGLKPDTAPEQEVSRPPSKPEPPSPPRPPEPTLWERYQERWPDAGGDRAILKALTEKPLPKELLRIPGRRGVDGWRQVLTGMFQGESFHLRNEPPKPLPRSLAPAGEASPDAALHATGYAGSLPSRYKGRFEEERIVERSLEAAAEVRQTWRYRRFAGEERRQTLEEDAIRAACGEDAQRLDREMHAERDKWRPYWDVLVRHDTLLQEEGREKEGQRQLEELRESMERSHTTLGRDRGKRGPTR